MCEHISKVLEWGFTDTHDFKATKYGCINCEETSPVPFVTDEVFIDHSKCGGPDVCFGCKAAGLQLSPGDAHSAKGMTNKKWEGELSAYREARAQGIQPQGTSMAKINEARRASDVMGKAFDANTMGNSEIIQNNTVSKLKEVGLV
jgi:hypothetical protein